MFLMTDNSQAHSAELVSQSAKLLQHVGPVMENMGDMLSTLDSSHDEQDQDTGRYWIIDLIILLDN